MLAKILFLFCISAVLANELQVTPAELKTFFQDIDTEVKNLQEQATVLIRRNLVPLENACVNAKSNIAQNLTDCTKYYWSEIRMLEAKAKQIGQDYSKCIKIGNDKLYALNNSTINSAYDGIAFHNHSGLRLVDSSFTQQFQTTPDEVKTLLEDIDEQVKYLQHEANINIRLNLVPLDYYCGNAKSDIIQNLTDNAKPYWDEIKKLEENAKVKKQDISKCTKIGNNQLYALNESIVQQAYNDINYLNTTGLRIIDSSFTQSYSVIDELFVLRQLVDICDDESCAANLKVILTKYLARTKPTLDDAQTKSSNYAQIYLPRLLTPVYLDANAYVANYTVYLKNVKECINKL